MVARQGPAAPTDPPAGATAAEQILEGVRQSWRAVSGLDPRDLLFNLVLSGVCLAAAYGLIWTLRRLSDAWLRRLDAEASSETKKRDTPQVAGLTWLLLRLSIIVGALVLVARIWGVDLFARLAGGAGAGLLRAVLVTILAVGVVEIAGFLIDRLMGGLARRSRSARRAAQIRTLGPLIRGSVQAVLAVVAALTFLSEIGVSVGPLLASAGVVGVAVGFGSQTLVKDFLTGLFLVAEDVVSVGDNVRIGSVGGTVEAMTLRTIRLRDLDGTLHIFPYSEAQVIHNRTASYSSYVADVMVTYGTDVDRALAVMGEVGEALRRSPEFSRRITQPIEVMGVERLDPQGVLLRARATTRPRDQWVVGREYNRRLKLAFEAEGIGLAYRPIGPPAPSAPSRSSAGPKAAPRPAEDDAES
ncbi:MAG: mechanosensitive ion channel family protein [Phenylobacterium sp.]|uniref:mechanosensitive ion channel family protein n=1 Tax=Phenylobacterium sp. TaxID=1871053 RepID=UPI00391AAA4C